RRAAAVNDVGSSGWGQRQPQQREKFPWLLSCSSKRPSVVAVAAWPRSWTKDCLTTSSDGRLRQRQSAQRTNLRFYEMIQSADGTAELRRLFNHRWSVRLSGSAPGLLRFNYLPGGCVARPPWPNGAGVDTTSVGRIGRAHTPANEKPLPEAISAPLRPCCPAARQARPSGSSGHTAAELAATRRLYPASAWPASSTVHVGELTVSLAGDGDGEDVSVKLPPASRLDAAAPDDESRQNWGRPVQLFLRHRVSQQAVNEAPSPHLYDLARMDVLDQLELPQRFVWNKTRPTQRYSAAFSERKRRQARGDGRESLGARREPDYRQCSQTAEIAEALVAFELGTKPQSWPSKTKTSALEQVISYLSTQASRLPPSRPSPPLLDAFRRSDSSLALRQPAPEQQSPVTAATSASTGTTSSGCSWAAELLQSEHLLNAEPSKATVESTFQKKPDHRRSPFSSSSRSSPQTPEEVHAQVAGAEQILRRSAQPVLEAHPGGADSLRGIDRHSRAEYRFPPASLEAAAASASPRGCCCCRGLDDVVLPPVLVAVSAAGPVATSLPDSRVAKPASCWIVLSSGSLNSFRLSSFCSVTRRLKKIGVRQVGVRRRILEAVRQLHRRPWRDSSMPQLATGRPPAAADYLAILANLHRHLEFMNATLKYLTDHAEAAAADAAADAAAAKASVASAGQPSAAAAATAAVEAAMRAPAGPADGLRNQRVLARPRNSCRLAAGECRRLLGRLETGLAALQRLQPVERPDRLPAIGEAGSNKSVKWNFAAIGVGAAVCAAATVAGFLVAAKRR
uniref:Protein kinase domain-containing protein n=1 Tax=Macrostomum lignano TaxID=282301 RepID=A0A1I8JPT6_9PLAT